MKRFLNKLRRDENGVVSLEFALIAPMMIFGTLFAINLGYQVNKQQKIASSMAAGSNYLQDYLMENAVEDLHPGNQSESNLINTVRQVVQSAYGDDLLLEEVFVDTYCGCPNPAGISQGGTNVPEDGSFEMAIEQPTEQQGSGFDFQDPEEDFYNRTSVASSGRGEICSYECPEPVNGRARVIMELQVYHRMSDLFGKESIVHQQMKTRVR